MSGDKWAGGAAGDGAVYSGWATAFWKKGEPIRRKQLTSAFSGTPQSPLPAPFDCVLGSFLCHFGSRPHGVFLFALPPTPVCGCMRAALAWWQLKAGSGYRVPTLGRGYARFRKRAFNSLNFTKPETEWHGARRTSWSLKCPRKAHTAKRPPSELGPAAALVLCDVPDPPLPPHIGRPL